MFCVSRNRKVLDKVVDVDHVLEVGASPLHNVLFIKLLTQLLPITLPFMFIIYQALMKSFSCVSSSVPSRRVPFVSSTSASPRW